MFLKLKKNILINGWKKHKQEKRLRAYLIITLTLLFLIGEYRFFYKIFVYLREEVEILSKQLTIQLVNILNLTFLSMLFFSNLTNAIYYFFISEDLELLISYPIKRTKLLFQRYIENTLASSWMVFFAMLPFYLSMIAAFNFHFKSILFILLIYIPFFLALSALGSIITMLIVRFFPAKRAYQILWSISAIFIGLIFVIIRLIRPERLFRKTEEGEFLTFIKSLETPEYPYLPSTWLSKAISSITFDNSYVKYLSEFFLIISFFTFSVLIFYFLSKRIFQDSFTRSRASFRKKTKRAVLLDKLINLFPFNKTLKNFYLKDIKDVIRDPGQWSQLLLLLGLVFVYLFSIKSLPIEKVITINMVAFFNTGILSFIMAALVNRFVFPSFSVEGRCLWIIKSFPVKISNVFLGKFLLFLIPLLVFAVFLSLMSNYLLGVDRFIYIFTFLNVITMTSVLVFLGLSIGMLYPKFKYSNVTE
ncbi:MAG: hypothetical protein N2999_02675, partial [Proteobacteria bacterium]|nr:hypothetical protein [Pseudomonadota bacterium]